MVMSMAKLNRTVLVRKATQYLDLKAYDASIEKIEKDVNHFFTELGQLKNDF